jgi:hypothetical protein
MTYAEPIDTESGCAAELPRTAAPSAGVFGDKDVAIHRRVEQDNHEGEAGR